MKDMKALKQHALYMAEVERSIGKGQSLSPRADALRGKLKNQKPAGKSK